MNKYLLTLLALLTASGAFAQFLSTSNDNSTANLIRITGQSNIPLTGAGLELGYNTMDGNGHLSSYDRSSGLFKKMTFFAKDICLLPQNGNVGVGTVNALARLHVFKPEPISLETVDVAFAIEQTATQTSSGNTFCRRGC